MGGDSMESAAQRVANHIGNTIDTADIYNKLTQNGSCPVSGVGDRFYTRGGLKLVLIWRLPMSEKLAYQIRTWNFFAEISHAWTVIDSDIFLWNDDTNDDLAYFDAVEITVLKNTLARVKSDVFASHITHALVVGTVTDLSLYPVIMDFDPVTGRSGIVIDTSHFFKHNTGWFGDGRKCRVVNQSVTTMHSDTISRTREWSLRVRQKSAAYCSHFENDEKT